MAFPRVISLFALSWLPACSEAEEAKRVELLLVTDSAGFEPVTTDLAYEVELTSASMVVDDLQLTIAGEQHSSLLGRFCDWLVPVAHAHPGHFQGGEVTGELPGHFVLRFEPGLAHEVGTATLLVGTYQGLDLTLALADAADVKDDDPLLGHTAYLTATASNDAGTVSVQVVMDSPPGRQLVGIPFEQTITESTAGALALRLSPHDALEDDTLFDGVDFAALDADGDGSVVIGPASSDEALSDAYNQIHRAFQSHDHFVLQAQN